MSDILATPKGRKITLSDGKKYTLAPFSLTTLADLEEEFDCDMEELPTKLTERTATGFRKFLWVLLRGNYQDMSLHEAGKLVLLEQVTSLIQELAADIDKLKA